MQWRLLNHMRTVCTSLQTDNRTNTSSLNFFTGRMLYLTPNQRCQSTEGTQCKDLNVEHGNTRYKHKQSESRRELDATQSLSVARPAMPITAR